MATISTAIELNDNFTGVLNNIVNAMNMTVPVMEQMQDTMNDPVDPSALDGIRNYVNQATIAVQDLTTALGTIEPPAIPTPSAPEWQSAQWMCSQIRVLNAISRKFKVQTIC